LLPFLHLFVIDDAGGVCHLFYKIPAKFVHRTRLACRRSLLEALFMVRRVRDIQQCYKINNCQGPCYYLPHTSPFDSDSPLQFAHYILMEAELPNDVLHLISSLRLRDKGWSPSRPARGRSMLALSLHKLNPDLGDGNLGYSGRNVFHESIKIRSLSRICDFV
jgi:hypothetical protein